MSTYLERKAERVAHFEKYVKGWKLVKCTACNGSGRYGLGKGRPCRLERRKAARALSPSSALTRAADITTPRTTGLFQ